MKKSSKIITVNFYWSTMDFMLFSCSIIILPKFNASLYMYIESLISYRRIVANVLAVEASDQLKLSTGSF